MASRTITDCHWRLRRVWLQCSRIWEEKYPAGPTVFLTCTYRSNEEQAQLYAKGRTAPGSIVTHIKANGKHNLFPAHAFDIAFKDSKGVVKWDAVYFERFAAIVKEEFKDVQWGGDWKNFKDMPHFEI